MGSPLFERKPLKLLLQEMEHGEGRLKRVLGPWQLTALGIGAIIGAGIFVATGAAAHDLAGPALMMSYVVAGITCVFAALCYAEFASMAPVAGSAYTYAYATLGEMFAWIIGWDLVLEYAVGSATVANGWSSYFQSVLAKFGIALPVLLSSGPWKYDEGFLLPNSVAEYQGAQVTQKALKAEEGRPEGIYWVLAADHATLGAKGTPVGLSGDPAVESQLQKQQRARFNLPAVLIVALVTFILVKGIQESARFNAMMVFIKVAAVLFVILVGAFFINPDNWKPFAPYGWSGVSFFGIHLAGQTNAKGEPVGMLAGAAIIFFAYIGFDAVSTQAEEARRPKKDVPFGIIASLLVCTVLYIAVVAVLTGMVTYDQLDVNAPVSDAFAKAGLPWAEFIIAAAGVAGITSVLLVMLLSAPRVFLAMARDGLVPKRFFASVHPRFQTPWKSTIAIGACVALAAGLLPIEALLHLTNIGTLLAFVIVCSAVLVMRRTNPEVERPFRCPMVPLVPALGILCCLVLMFSLPPANWWRLAVWLALGLGIYFLYGRHHSVMARMRREGRTPG
ncbi:MAG: amino acid permease [Planctomycetota bacterium]|nr:MAG: amino acid permease [Planctomycetota bacterium]